MSINYDDELKVKVRDIIHHDPNVLTATAAITEVCRMLDFDRSICEEALVLMVSMIVAFSGDHVNEYKRVVKEIFENSKRLGKLKNDDCYQDLLQTYLKAKYKTES